MKEFLSIAADQSQPEDNNGPGPQTLIGYTEEDTKGFFGEVPNSELITMSELTSQLGVTQGGAQNLTSPWLKFYLDGRILFVAKKNIRYSISYDHLRDLNLVDGSKIITIGGLQYKVGLLGGIDDDYTGAVTDGFNQPFTMRSEWTRLMYNVASDEGVSTSYQKQGQIGDNWIEYPLDNSADGLNFSAGYGRYSWCKELNPTNSTQAVHRGYPSVASVNPRSSSYSATNGGWRPVLELIQ